VIPGFQWHEGWRWHVRRSLTNFSVEVQMSQTSRVPPPIYDFIEMNLTYCQMKPKCDMYFLFHHGLSLLGFWFAL